MKELKLGDVVVVFRRIGGNYLTEITGETKTLWKTDDGSRWVKRTGYEYGTSSSWSGRTIDKASQEDVERLLRKKYRDDLVHKLRTLKWDVFNRQELDVIYAALQKALDMRAARKEQEIKRGTKGP